MTKQKDKQNNGPEMNDIQMNGNISGFIQDAIDESRSIVKDIYEEKQSLPRSGVVVSASTRKRLYQGI